MPTLKQITCNVEWTSSNAPLHEYQTIYADGFVETYVAVPPIPAQFSIHLRSHGYIAPGLAMFVYMDGEYQCNRNRSNLKTPSEARTWKQTEVDFQVRQREEVMPNGSFSGKQWKFELLRTGKSKETPEAWKTNISAESSHQIVPAKRLAPHDAQYVGTIEVVVLRCYPTQPSTKITPSTSLAASVPFVRPQKASSPLTGGTDTSSPSSSDVESTSSESVASLMAGMFDGTADYPGDPSRSVQPRRSSYIGSSPGKADTRPSGNLPSAPIRYEQFYDMPDPQKWRTRTAPDGKGRDHDNDRGQNTSHSSARHSNHEHHKNTSEPPNRASRNLLGSTAQRIHNGNDSNDRFSNSNRSRNSRAGSVATRSSPNAAWVQPQGSPAQAAPAVVINVSHGTPQPAVSSSLANTQTLNNESAKVDTWHNPSQADKIDEYLEGTNRSPEGSNGSKVSKRSNNSGVWLAQDYANDQPKENSIEQANAQWQNKFSQEQSNENQWATVQGTWNPEGEHETSNYHNDSHTWDNNIVGSQPLESSSMEVQNNSNGRSNENSNVSNHTSGDDNTGHRQPPPQNSSRWTPPTYPMEGKSAYTVGSAQPKGTGIEWSGRAENSGSVKSFVRCGDSNELRHSVHPSPPGQGAQQHSSPSSHKSAFSKPTWGHDAPNPQIPWTTNYEAPRDVAPQPWSDRAVESNNHGLGSPQPAAPQIYGSTLPMPIDPRPRPYWSNWGQPRRVGNVSKAVVPRVEPAEPLHYVPSEVAQRNKMSHQVYVGQPAEYVHKSASPKYMDDFSRPYAVFVFKYRSRGNPASSRQK